ncbi:hypothetical protein CANARDRAFT_28606 [[Candida] arabinofermentans NRRL YB-2248]|uniref:Uncharacterized protein n=1 Tax=[Candida] arabinofermentans NRRL YB-2248 TaxID=983967 RepID=A0A1E4SZE2_9ASCO|nr:hypothetical protein CANARDRAFT_28606 [[Candida] arabinofermentans NRRL YB-2248]
MSKNETKPECNDYITSDKHFVFDVDDVRNDELHVIPKVRKNTDLEVNQGSTTMQ